MVSRPQVAYKWLPHGQGLEPPAYMTAHASGLDLPAALEQDGPLTIQPGQIVMVPTGLALAIPPGYEGQVRPRSGLAVKYGLTLVNTPGTIDCDYRGELKVIMINLGPNPVTLKRGDRLAQLIIAPVSQAELIQVEELPATQRGEGGFGHTG